MKLAATTIFFVFLLCITNHLLVDATEQENAPIFTSVWFSCVKQTANQSFWKDIENVATNNGRHRIDVLSGLGDNGYFDKISPVWPFRVQATPADIRAGFRTFFNDSNFTNFLAKVDRLAGFVRDDHELKNDGDETDLYRPELQQLFLDALHVPRGGSRKQELVDEGKSLSTKAGREEEPAVFPPSAPLPFPRFSKFYSEKEINVRRNKRFGLYSFEKVPLQAAEKKKEKKITKNVCYVNLDVRTHRNPPGKGEDILGAAQWRWLEHVLETGRDPEIESSAARGGDALDESCVLTLIASGIQILSDEKPTEGWQQHPASRDRLLKLIAKGNAGNKKRIVLLSGDVHLGEMFRVGKEEDGFPFDYLYEVTSSGLTHSASAVSPYSKIEVLTPAVYNLIFPTRRRVGDAFLQKNFGMIRIYESAGGSSEAFRVVVTVHSLATGDEVIRLELPYPAAAAESADAIFDQHLKILHAPLTRAILGIHNAVAPSAPRYLTIAAVILAAFIALIMVALAVLRLMRRFFKSKRD